MKEIELMEKLDNKYNMNNVLSLDEYLCEHYNILTSKERIEISNLLT
jgi:hypothetical protein